MKPGDEVMIFKRPKEHGERALAKLVERIEGDTKTVDGQIYHRWLTKVNWLTSNPIFVRRWLPAPKKSELDPVRNPGDEVTIFYDPCGETVEEFKATLVEFIGVRFQRSDNVALERWIVDREGRSDRYHAIIRRPKKGTQ